MLARAPAALCRGSTLERAILSLVRGGRMVAETAYFEGDERGRAARWRSCARIRRGSCTR